MPIGCESRLEFAALDEAQKSAAAHRGDVRPLYAASEIGVGLVTSLRGIAVANESMWIEPALARQCQD